MPNYVDDPANPGKRIDVIDLQKRNPYQPLPPYAIRELLKRDRWTRRDALLILAGYHPRNVVDGAGHPIGTVGAGVIFLDGTNQALLGQAGLQHPCYPDPMLYDFMTLAEYANGSDKEKSPQEWLAWAKEKDFTPYWLEYIGAIQSEAQAPVEVVDNPERQTGPVIANAPTESLGAHEYPDDICALFDPLPINGIGEVFHGVGLDWRKLAERASRNGLRECRIIRNGFNPAKVAAWLVGGGHLSKERADRLLAKNLPPRSTDNAHLITGEYPR
ncbi:hypothetical protein FEMY_04370 [Ferrovum myxofaciens]|uniref:Uncharacterized protein n=1 Tax=Ferrovum myxofaciens TaxID=416213 RepID=A0A149W0E7_9PROT|nr:hypothetical protein [Ferrovum myxofaciens]KXW58918.1 hypothetical protein FEMY_04370 [Ferrovum myxofaciens]